jgi:hypothetical protein
MYFLSGLDTLIENLKSNLYFHGHPINRREAKEDLKLKVELPSPEVETLMWDLYLQYADELKLMEPFNPLHELEAIESATITPSGPLTMAQILAQLQEMAKSGVGLGTPGLTEKQIIDLAAAMIPHISGTSSADKARLKLQKIKGGYLEALDSSNVFLSDLTLERFKVNTPAGPQDAVKQEATWQRWELETETSSS